MNNPLRAVMMTEDGFSAEVYYQPGGAVATLKVHTPQGSLPAAAYPIEQWERVFWKLFPPVAPVRPTLWKRIKAVFVNAQ